MLSDAVKCCYSSNFSATGADEKVAGTNALSQYHGHCDQCLGHCRSVFATVPELAALLPPEAPPQAHPYIPLGLNGQQARATVYVEEVILPQAEEGVHERPKQALYHVSYRSISQPSDMSPTTVHPSHAVGAQVFTLSVKANNHFCSVDVTAAPHANLYKQQTVEGWRA